MYPLNRQILWTLLLWYSPWSEEMLLWAQFHSEKNPHLLVSGTVGNDRTSKLRREKLRLLQDGPNVCFPAVTPLMSQRYAGRR